VIVNILNKLKSNGAYFGLCLAGCTLWSRTASAEVTLVDKDGWVFAFNGRVNAFLSAGSGDDFPVPTPGGPTMHKVMGTGSQAGNGIADVGWPSSYQTDQNGKYFAVRVRSGLFGNILGFALTRKFNETTSVRGYVSIWSTVETLGRDKWAPVVAEAREGYFTATGTWGSVTGGRMLGLLGRTSYEIDALYGHGYGLGLPCTDALGPACGHIGTGVLFPGYSAGFYYTTPNLGGLQVNVGVFDPVVLNPSLASDWSRATIVRGEGAVTYDASLGDTGKLKFGLEGLFQPLSRVNSKGVVDMNGIPVIDPATGSQVQQKTDESTSIWGVSGGARAELGPVRIGVSAFHGKGIGLSYAAQRTTATEDNDNTATAIPNQPSYELRTFTGLYAQAAVILGNVHLAAGFGQGSVDQLDTDKVNPNLSVIHTQTGISAAAYYHVSDSVVLGLDWFHYSASWYGAPIVDTTTMQATGQKLAGEKQNLDFVNAGVTYHW
jgi:hypothetical protein